MKRQKTLQKRSLYEIILNNTLHNPHKMNLLTAKLSVKNANKLRHMTDEDESLGLDVGYVHKPTMKLPYNSVPLLL